MQADNGSILFVSLGNVCRSPMALGLFRHRVAEAGLSHRFNADACGTGRWHAGQPPDPRAVHEAARHGIDITGLRARQVTAADFERSDRILAMDRDVLRALEDIRPWPAHARLGLLLDHAPQGPVREVFDPYCGGKTGFSSAFTLIDRAVTGLLEDLRS